MYGLFDESRLPSNGGTGVDGLTRYSDDQMVDDTTNNHRSLSRILCINSYDTRDTAEVNKSEINKVTDSRPTDGLDQLLNFHRTNNNNNREMVAQDMAQSYNQLFHAAQEPQDFVSLEELRPQVHHGQNVVVASGTHIYLNERDNEHGLRTYFNLATLPNEIRTQNAGIDGDKSLAPTSVSPISPPAKTELIAESNEQSHHQGDKPSNTSVMHIGQQPAASSHRNHHHQRHHHKQFQKSDSGSEHPSDYSPGSRKRKLSSQDESDILDDATDDAKSTRTNTDSKKQNHSEIEKRRRDKMNTYITELSSMIPMCHAMSRKLDKLTVLRMAVQHLKTILGAVTSYSEGHYKPAFLSDQELKTLILQAAEGFVFVVGCDRGRILYVSESVSKTLNYSQRGMHASLFQDELLGQSWFDILHPKDVAKVKEQLSSEHSPRDRLIDAKMKTDVPQGATRLGPGARRSFFCRMKRKVDANCGESQVKEEADTTTGGHRRKKQQNSDWKYCVTQCTGYLKSWAPAKIGADQEQEGEGLEGENCNLSCLVAVGRVTPSLLELSLGMGLPKLNTIMFVTRYAIDGKFIFVDQIATLVLGFLPQELLGTSMYEYYHHDDIPHLAESHKTALQTTDHITTQVYRFRAKTASFVRLQSEWFAFRNPWTKDIDYIIAKNSAIFCDAGQVESSAAPRSEGSSVQGNYDYFAQSNGGLERLISSHVEVSKIGRRIAEEVLDHQRRNEDSSSGSPLPTPDRFLLNTEIPTPTTTTVTSPEAMQEGESGVNSDNSSSNTASTFSHIRNNVPLNSIANEQVPCDGDLLDVIGASAMNDSPTPLTSDGNDEAAMAVIMSLLEADAGLGGPVDFSGLPWPLP
ncbi:aryl hydrocarbon receptor nuclear translocator-like protein 1 isoform X1 [Diachasma alloeum]|uniref:aryl hydrocarbon receptor nuclear translocator-like protein 1 isoform X1 n=1 Tax=Diachasma alloeum TaxID=454923 RepID=UPI0007383EFB|nr:aryl hydrocarbon receptor nuclear translocator-like protein 1 isoform X1 [Diachasma alloeum]